MQEALTLLLRGDHLGAAKLLQRAIDAGAPIPPPVPPLVSFSDDDLIDELARRNTGELDSRLWCHIQDQKKFVKENLHLVGDEDLLEELPFDLAGLCKDERLWSSMTLKGQEQYARERMLEHIDVAALRDLVTTLEG